MNMQLDPYHEEFNIFDDEIVQDVWADKYRFKDEETIQDTFLRVAETIMPSASNELNPAYAAMCKGLWMPGGRILSGAGTNEDTTLMNCYVCQDIPDSIQGIQESLGQAMITLSRYGGIGMNFGTIRPSGAKINREGLKAPGPLDFMDLFHHMANTIMQAGHRRGAMMGVLPDHHPDLLKFVRAKQEKGRLTNFNVSVLISDEFMRALADDNRWRLWHEVSPAGGPQEIIRMGDGAIKYVYATYRARDLWQLIMEATYEFSEPGVIFIDRINTLNNLSYCETINATNPCGEQPLPPNGTCNLGAINLARLIKSPFTDHANINWLLLDNLTRLGIRFLDSVIDVTKYPLPEQEKEEKAKRRLGLGISGLADAFAQMKIPYGHPKTVALTSEIMKNITRAAYEESIELAKEKGSFLLLHTDFSTTGFANQRLGNKLKAAISEHGIRNGVLLTIAPTGTTSILFGNISSGLEPVFAHQTKRKVIRANGKTEEYISEGFGARFYRYLAKRNDWSTALPEYMNEAKDVSPVQHIAIQAAAQEYVDASVSKTINVPEDFPFEQFQHIYEDAYDKGCKGCTTYRPSEVRGSILEPAERTTPEISTLVNVDFAEAEKRVLAMGKQGPEIFTGDDIGMLERFNKQTSRPERISGWTYKIVWPSLECSVFVTINDNAEEPWEIFIQSKDIRNVEWTTALSVMISRNWQLGDDPIMVADQLKQIRGSHDGQWVDGKYYGSLVAYIGELLQKHFTGEEPKATSGIELTTRDVPNPCPKCGAPTKMEEGCKKCTSCTWSQC